MANSNDVLPRWARCTLIGPFVPLYAVVTLAAFLGQVARVTDGRTDTWAAAMLLASFVGSLVVVCLVAVDVILLKVKLRRLPTGFLGWLSSMSSPIAVLVWLVVLPEPSTTLRAVLSVAGSFWLGALSVRLIMGRAP